MTGQAASWVFVSRPISDAGRDDAVLPYACTFGGSGKTAKPPRGTAPSRCDEVACRCRGRFAGWILAHRPRATITSTLLVVPNSICPPKLNPVEPPWYATRMPRGAP